MREPVLAARMGAPATVNIITPHALLAIPLHPPRLIKTLQQLGLLSSPTSAGSHVDQAAAVPGLRQLRRTLPRFFVAI